CQHYNDLFPYSF
nr:immunoglobulin light chain junction region [Macaca mulatta]MOX48976.1 immunoglobulin light chain junction region [Macaca mulatta]MOX50550.1 immunoglobulin light chain junction region [Macaca mulatta]